VTVTARSKTEQPLKEHLHWPSVIQLVFGLFLLFNAIVLAASTLIGGIVQLNIPAELGIGAYSFLYVGTALFLGFVGLVNAVLAGLRIAGRPVQQHQPNGRLRFLAHPLLWLLLSGLALGLGYLVSAYDVYPFFLLPPIHIAAVIFPLLLVVWLAVRGLEPGAPQRTWGVFSSGMLIGPIFIFALELIALLFLGLFILLTLSGDADLAFTLTRLLAYSQTTAFPDPERLLDIARPLLLQPVVLIAMLANFAVAVPLIEEIFKPMGVWLLAGKDLSPQEGFALGAISGAGYAAFETLSIQLAGEFWLAIVSIRSITGLLHALTAGLVGYGLVLAWGERRYLRLAGLYLLSVTLHGAWNGMVIMTSFVTLQNDVLNAAVEERLVASYWQVAGAGGLSVIALLVFGLLLWQNRRLRLAKHAVKM
jgi:hypothetical protein